MKSVGPAVNWVLTENEEKSFKRCFSKVVSALKTNKQTNKKPNSESHSYCFVAQQAFIQVKLHKTH